MHFQHCQTPKPKPVPAPERCEIEVIIEKIIKLQKRAVIEEIKDEFCDSDYLGLTICEKDRCNTRPLVVFTHNNHPWLCPMDDDSGHCNEANTTCVLRAERLRNDSVIFRALKEISKPGEDRCNREFASTNSFITIKLENIAALRCLDDTFVRICLDR